MHTPLVAVEGFDSTRGLVKVLSAPGDALKQLDSEDVRAGRWRLFDAAGRRVELSAVWRLFPPRKVPVFHDIPDAPPREDALREALVRYLLSCGLPEAEVSDAALPVLIARAQEVNARLDEVLAAAKPHRKWGCGPAGCKSTRFWIVWNATHLIYILSLWAWVSLEPLAALGDSPFSPLRDAALALCVVSWVVLMSLGFFLEAPSLTQQPLGIKRTVYALRTSIVLTLISLGCFAIYHFIFK